MLYPTLWEYQTIVKTSIDVSPYQLVHRVELILLIECEIPSLKLAIELLRETFELEERLVNLDHLDEQCQDALVDLEINKRRVKVQHDKSVCPRIFSEGDLVLLYDQASEPIGVGKFNPMRNGPYVVKWVLERGTYELEDYERTTLEEPRNGLYLKKYYV